MDGVMVKRELYRLLLNRVDEEIAALEHNVRTLQLSANEETKSSAGDKYETGRAMIQNEIEQIGIRLKEKIKVRERLKTFHVDLKYDHIQAGALAETSAGNFFFLVNGGEFVINGKKFMTVSISSPLGKVLHGHGNDAEVVLNNREIKINDIY